MLYLGTSPGEPLVADLLNRRKIGLMCQPKSNLPRVGWLWAADNGCFSKKWDEDRWLSWLRQGHPRSGCLFAVVPDVVGDAQATEDRFYRYSKQVAELRYPVAFAAQDGQEDFDPPWSLFDCLFIGGTTEWKLSEPARVLAARSRDRGKWVHVGRVNSDQRFATWAKQADSCDGTFLAFGPAMNAPKLERWLDNYDYAPQFDLAPAFDRIEYDVRDMP